MNPFIAYDDAAAWLVERISVARHRGPVGQSNLPDALIGLACVVISLFLVLHYLRPWQRRDVPYRGIVWTIAGFLLLCGVSRSLDVTAMNPASAAAYGTKLAMAAASWIAATR